MLLGEVTMVLGKVTIRVLHEGTRKLVESWLAECETSNFHISCVNHNFHRWALPYKCGFHGSPPMSFPKVSGRP